MSDSLDRNRRHVELLGMEKRYHELQRQAEREWLRALRLEKYREAANWADRARWAWDLAEGIRAQLTSADLSHGETPEGVAA